MSSAPVKKLNANASSFTPSFASPASASGTGSATTSASASDASKKYLNAGAAEFKPRVATPAAPLATAPPNVPGTVAGTVPGAVSAGGRTGYVPFTPNQRVSYIQPYFTHFLSFFTIYHVLVTHSLSCIPSLFLVPCSYLNHIQAPMTTIVPGMTPAFSYMMPAPHVFNPITANNTVIGTVDPRKSGMNQSPGIHGLSGPIPGVVVPPHFVSHPAPYAMAGPLPYHAGVPIHQQQGGRPNGAIGGPRPRQGHRGNATPVMTPNTSHPQGTPTSGVLGTASAANIPPPFLLANPNPVHMHTPAPTSAAVAAATKPLPSVTSITASTTTTPATTTGGPSTAPAASGKPSTSTAVPEASSVEEQSKQVESTQTAVPISTNKPEPPATAAALLKKANEKSLANTTTSASTTASTTTDAAVPSTTSTSGLTIKVGASKVAPVSTPTSTPVTSETTPAPRPLPVLDANGVRKTTYSIDELLDLRDYADAPSKQELDNACAKVQQIIAAKPHKYNPNRPGSATPGAGKEWRERGPGSTRHRTGRKVRSHGLEDVKLPRTENGYKIKRDTEGDERKLREFQSILNKLSQENISKLIKDCIDLELDVSDELISKVAEFVFQKAITEPAFAPVYAEFLRLIDAHAVEKSKGSAAPPPPIAPGAPLPPPPKSAFRTNIILLLQQRFESRTNVPAAEFAAMTPEQQQAVNVRKRELLGVIRFVGELYIRDIVTYKVPQHCVDTILQNPTIVEEDLEVLVQILQTAGHRLNLKRPQWMEEVITKVKELSMDKSRVSNRLRYLLMGVIDLKNNGWVPLTTAKPTPQQQQSGRDGQSSGAKVDRYRLIGNDQRRSSLAPGTASKTKEDKDDQWVTTGRRNEKNKAPSKATTSNASTGKSEEESKGTPAVPKRVNQNTFAALMNSDGDSSPTTTSRPVPGTGPAAGLASTSAATSVTRSSDEGDGDDDENVLTNNPETDDSSIPTDVLQEEISKAMSSFIKDDQNSDEALDTIAALRSRRGNDAILMNGFELAFEARVEHVAAFIELLSLFCTSPQTGVGGGVYILDRSIITPTFPRVLHFAIDQLVDVPISLDIVARACVGFSNAGAVTLPQLLEAASASEDLTKDDYLDKRGFAIFVASYFKARVAEAVKARTEAGEDAATVTAELQKRAKEDFASWKVTEWLSGFEVDIKSKSIVNEFNKIGVSYLL